MTMGFSLRSGVYVRTGPVLTDPAPRLSQDVTMATTVDGVACSMVADPPKGCGFFRLRVDGVNWVDTPLSHGQGIQFAHNILPAGWLVSYNANSPTEGGNVSDGSTLLAGTTNNLYRSLSADGLTLYRRTASANWDKPGQTTAVQPGINNRLVANTLIVTQKTVWGWNGDPHIIQYLADVDVSNAPINTAQQELDMVHCSVYPAQSIFDTVQTLVPSTGALGAYAGFPTKLTDRVIVASSADGTKAMCVYQPLNEWGATGYAQQLFSAGLNNFFIRAREVATNIPFGVRMQNCFLVIASDAGGGAVAKVITSVMALDAANIVRTQPIALPDFNSN